VLLAPGVHGELVWPSGPPLAAVLVLAGSSGRVDVHRARLLAQHGAISLALQWFGGAGQPPGICEVPLATFALGLDLLCHSASGLPLGIIGTSKGAEAALLVATVDHRVDAVVALAPTHVAWANVGPGLDGQAYPYRSSWSMQGVPLPFVTYDETWEPHGVGPVAYRVSYERSLALDDGRAAAARIRVERTQADLLLVAGGDDRMWPSLPFANAVLAARRTAGLPAQVIGSAGAGHRVTFPGERPLPASPRYQYGGTVATDAELGRRAWPQVLESLSLRPRRDSDSTGARGTLTY